MYRGKVLSQGMLRNAPHIKMGTLGRSFTSTPFSIVSPGPAFPRPRPRPAGRRAPACPGPILAGNSDVVAYRLRQKLLASAPRRERSAHALCPSRH